MQLVVVEEDFSFVNFKNQKIFPLQFGKKKRRRNILDSNNNTGKINRQTPVEERNTTACLVLPPFDIILVVPSTNPPFIKIIRLFLHSTTTWSFFPFQKLFESLLNGQNKIWHTNRVFLSRLYARVCSRHLIWIPPLSSSATATTTTTMTNWEKEKERRRKKEKTVFSSSPSSSFSLGHTQQRDTQTINRDEMERF